MSPFCIYCVDVGSVPKNRFGWARQCAHAPINTSADPQHLVDTLVADLEADRPVALGFECPLFIPLVAHPALTTSARECEVFLDTNGRKISRPWSAGAGACALTTGLAQTVWLLQAIRQRLTFVPPAFLDWEQFTMAQRGLFLWEAFVTGQATTETHPGDAAVAVSYFAAAMPNIIMADVNTDHTVFSNIGAALLRCGWCEDLGLLARPCVVLRVS